jgi:uncharacterized lipoprotein YbaY
MKQKINFAFAAQAIMVVMALTLVSLAGQAQTSTFNLATCTGTGADYTWADPVLTVNNGANIEITGSVSNGRRIEIPAGAIAGITLNGVSITNPGPNQSPLRLHTGGNICT